MADTQELAPYTITICKGSALLREMKALLRAWQPGESPADFKARVLREDILGKTTARRAEDLVGRVFVRRFLRPDDRAARLLKHLLSGDGSPELFSDLCMLYSARLDTLLRETIAKVYWPAAEAGQISFGQRDVLAFIENSQAQGRMEKPWSDKVRVKVARGLLRALCDFGLLQEVRRSRYEIRNYHPTEKAVVYLANDLHFSGATDSGLIRHPDWQIFGLRPPDVVSAMDRLATEGWWIIQAAGSVVRITWTHKSMEEVADALAR